MKIDIIPACTLLILALIVFTPPLLYYALASPFKYPHFEHDFDVSGKHQPQIDGWLDNFLISGGFEEIQKHWKKIEQWKQKSRDLIEHSPLKKYRTRQYEKALDDDRAFVFQFVRSKTIYTQKNYVKHANKVSVIVRSYAYSYEYIQNRYNSLKDIGLECTLRQYHTKNQRNLATRELREKIMIRDHYTCQLCGKYMPDEVGLQIDHIIPVSKGGKTVESNLRVLCSKCNGSKSDKMPSQLH